MARSLLTAAGLVLLTACASAPPVPPPAVAVQSETKLASILRLEDHRVLADERSAPQVVAPVLDQRGRLLPTPPPTPGTDLLTLLADEEARVRRRAALGIGRVGLADGIEPLGQRLSDSNADVRAMAAFALGLIGGATVVPALTDALSDPSPLVRGRAASALGLVGREHAGPAADTVARMVADYVASGALSTVPPDDPPGPLTPETEAVRRGLVALGSLDSYDSLAAAILDGEGRPRSSWWPVAFALSRVEDPRTIPGLRELLSSPSVYTVAHALRGLASRKDAGVIDDLLPLLDARREVHRLVRVHAVRLAAQLGDARTRQPLIGLLLAPGTDDMIRLEVVDALGRVGGTEVEEVLIDHIAHRWPPLRAAVLRALAQIDQDMFTTILSGLDPDGDWRVRAALADALAGLPRDRAEAMLERLRDDADRRVIPAVLRAMAAVELPDLEAELGRGLASDDAAVRRAAAGVIGERKLTGLRPALVEALARARGTQDVGVRHALLDAIGQLGGEEATPHFDAALGDADWSIRLRAQRWFDAQGADPGVAARIRPAPVARDPGVYESERLVAPKVSPQAYIDTTNGSIIVELAVLDAPLTVDNFITLARQGYFNGLAVHRVVPGFVVQDGDPRGDGTGGPGYSIRDELHDGTYGRGVLGMALAGPDTGGSQWFLTLAPHPHLDGRYTIFGHVIENVDLLDTLRVGDTITRIRIWDGVEMR
jgi:cyclophilin family peptidyl-prolyl cis-trans isomerase/HEAT repeat protein